MDRIKELERLIKELNIRIDRCNMREMTLKPDRLAMIQRYQAELAELTISNHRLRRERLCEAHWSELG